MEGISKDRLLKLREHFNKDYSIVEAKVIQDLLNECQEPWMTLDEFLKSGFRGRCWINFRDERVYFCRFVDGIFFSDDTGFSVRRDFIIKVMPIHKPEPPR